MPANCHVNARNINSFPLILRQMFGKRYLSQVNEVVAAAAAAVSIGYRNSLTDFFLLTDLEIGLPGSKSLDTNRSAHYPIYF